MCSLYEVLNPLNATLNPICKSQLAELFCGVFKYLSIYDTGRLSLLIQC